MGASMKDIKHRIKSVESTMQITKAMELVASSKLRKAKERAEAARPFFNILYETIADLSEHLGDENAYTAPRKGKAPLYIVIAGDRGLAGGYNSNIFKMVDPLLSRDARVIAIGKKSVEHYERRPWKIEGSYAGIAEDLNSDITAEIAETVLKLWDNEEVGEVHLAFTQFVTPLTQEATLMKMLPLTLPKSDGVRKVPMIYDPSPAAVFRSAIPQYLAGMVYGGIVESFASEQGARRTAMESASNNASDMISALSLSYNRARQAAITQELTEIVSGANATT